MYRTELSAILAYFGQNLVAMATPFPPLKIRIAYLNPPTPNTICVPFAGCVAGYATSRLRQRNTRRAPASQLRRLQSVLNAAARLIHRSCRYEHVTPMLQDLHWLRSPECIDFKLAVLVYRCLNGLAPRPTTFSVSPTPIVAVSGRRHPRS